MKKGDKIIKCGFCATLHVANINGKTGYAVCPKCGDETRISIDKYYGIKTQLAVIGHKR